MIRHKVPSGKMLSPRTINAFVSVVKTMLNNISPQYKAAKPNAGFTDLKQMVIIVKIAIKTE